MFTALRKGEAGIEHSTDLLTRLPLRETITQIWGSRKDEVGNRTM